MTKMSKAQRTAILMAHARRAAHATSRPGHGDWVLAPSPTVEICVRQGWARRVEGILGDNVARVTPAGLIAAGVDMDALHAEAETEDESRLRKVDARHYRGQRNALGTVIGCDCAKCTAVIQAIKNDNLGHKIQGV